MNRPQTAKDHRDTSGNPKICDGAPQSFSFQSKAAIDDCTDDPPKTKHKNGGGKSKE